MQKEELKKGSLFYYREEEKHRLIANALKDESKCFIEVTAPAMQKISPMLILDQGEILVHPFINIENKKELFNEVIPKESILIQSFEKIKEIEESDLIRSESKEIELVKPEDNNQEKRHFDKYNLIRGFVFSHDPLDSFTFNSSEEFDDVELKYDNLNDKLNNIFGIKINN